MIGFGLSEEQELVRQSLRDFADQVMRPAARDATGRVIRSPGGER